MNLKKETISILKGWCKELCIKEDFDKAIKLVDEDLDREK